MAPPELLDGSRECATTPALRPVRHGKQPCQAVGGARERNGARKTVASVRVLRSAVGAISNAIGTISTGGAATCALLSRVSVAQTSQNLSAWSSSCPGG